MSGLEDRILPIEAAATEGQLAINLIFKLLANLHALGKLDDDELTGVAKSLIAELNSDHARFIAWERLEDMTPDYERPKDDQEKDDR